MHPDCASGSTFDGDGCAMFLIATRANAVSDLHVWP